MMKIGFDNVMIPEHWQQQQGTMPGTFTRKVICKSSHHNFKYHITIAMFRFRQDFENTFRSKRHHFLLINTFCKTNWTELGTLH